jgi:hypothetical protein
LPKGARLEQDADNPRNWKLVWTPGEDDAGDEAVRIPLLVKDEDDQSEITTLLVKVDEVNVAPVIASVNGAARDDEKPWEVAGKEGAPVSITIMADDADRPANMLSIEGGEGFPEDAIVEPVKDKPRAWSLTWTPGEEFGGDKPVELPSR